MAQHNISSDIQTLIASGMTEAQIKAKVRNIFRNADGQWYANGNKAADEVEDMAAAVAPVPVEQVATDEPRATEKQVAYALALAAKNAEGSLTLTAEGLRRMGRREVSRLIDSLKSEW